MGRVFGGVPLLTLYLCGAFVGASFHVSWDHLQRKRAGRYDSSPSTPVLGASGAVNSIIVHECCLFPFRTVLLYGVLPVPAILLGGAFFVYDATQAGRAGPASTVGHACHVGGAFYGAAVALMFRLRGRWW